MRQLSNQEKKLNENAIKRIKKRNKEIIYYYLPKAELELDQGLQISLDKHKQEYKSTISNWRQEVQDNENQIKILQNQIDKGVEPKKSK